MTEKYQGWTNYPTWAVKLWLDNDESLYYEYRTLNRRHRDIDDLAQALKELVTELVPPCHGLAADLLAYALDEIAWDEIAQAIREDEEDDEDIEE